MFDRLRQSMIACVTVIVLSVFVFAPATVSAQADLRGAIDQNLGKIEAETGLSVPAGGLPATVGKIIKGALLFVGTIFVTLIMYGGFLWMMARGNTDMVSRAQDYIKNSIIGLLIIFASYAITFTVFDILLQVSTT